MSYLTYADIWLSFGCHLVDIWLENRVNSFMATVEVVDVKYTEATTGHYEELETNIGILVLYK